MTSLSLTLSFSFPTALTVLLCLLAAARPVLARPRFQRFEWGDVRGVVLSDGPFDLCGNPFTNMGVSEYHAYLRRLHRQAAPLRRGMNVLVADVNGRRYLVDAGASISAARAAQLRIPFFSDAGLLLESMRLAGISPKSIDTVLLTHGHFDHVLGLTTDDGQRVFPRAHVYISRNEHRFWTNTNASALNRRSSPASQQLIPLLRSTYTAAIRPYARARRLHTITAGARPFPGVLFRQTRGHSPGHMSIQLGKRKPHLLVAGDVFMITGIQFKRIDAFGAIEYNPAQLIRNRRKLLEHLAKSRDLVLTYHETFPGLGFVEPDGKGTFDWITAPIEELDGNQTLQCQTYRTV